MLAHEKEIHQRAANDTALAAIGRRKRTANVAFGESSVSACAASTTVVMVTHYYREHLKMVNL